MSVSSRARYMLWRATRSGRPLPVELTTGERLTVRPAPELDLTVAYEVFVGKAYNSPVPLNGSRVKFIVDVGANVGFTTIFLGRRFPAAEILAFEPHPCNAEFFKRNVAANGMGNRVTLRRGAAGCKRSQAWLTNNGAQSALSARPGPGKIEVEVVDFFSMLGSRRIDLLKLDCEGCEYELLLDPRFESRDVGALAMEWHETAEHPRAREVLFARLRALGWDLYPGIEGEAHGIRCGLVWAYKAETNSGLGVRLAPRHRAI